MLTPRKHIFYIIPLNIMFSEKFMG